MRPTLLKFYKKLSFWALGLLVLAGCDLQKQSGFNRQMQNLTAHYNILFNANEIVAQKQAATAVSFVDAYDRFLSVYPDTAAKTSAPDKDLVAVVTRANTIISDKSQSHYLGDAYLLLGKANYLQTNFFNAIEFLNYVIRSYPKQQNLVQEARVWKARSLMRINQMMLADTTIDTALHSIFPKEKNIADIYATKLQFDIYAARYLDGEEMAKQAIKYSGDIDHKLRWTYILAQLQEQNHKPADAAATYTRIVNSNASFEMAFNASLNRIRIEEKQAGEKLTRVQSLRRLLKDDKNRDFIDQIYFQIGDLYLADGKVDDAILNFKLSVRKSSKNLNQKGLSYLRLADINFKNKANYPLAKKYYDSTLTSLSPNYPGYQAIFKKSSNLQLLTDRLLIIAHEDTLQMLAKLDTAARVRKIKAMAKAQIDEQKTIAANASNAVSATSPFDPIGGISGNFTGTFYFYNTNAVSQGFTDFKKLWGNRPLTDNWRRSTNTATQTNNAQVAGTIQNLNASSLPNRQKSTNDVIADKIQQDITRNLPLTPLQVEQSNTRILNAYLDIASFYRDILDDKKEAILVYEQVLKRFPNNPNKASNYYNLYRLYSDIDPAKSDYYKNLILKDYSESNFAKVIQDPDFNQKLNDRNAEYTAFYNQLFDQVLKRNYKEAATRAGEMIAQYPDNSLTPQVYYLRMIALGHTETVDPFRQQLQEIVDKFPDDRLITPLVKQHLQFIDANQADLKQRAIVLVDSDPNEIPFLLRSIPIDRSYTPPAQNMVKQPVAPPKTATKPAAPTTVTDNPAVKAKVDAPKEAPSIFSLRDSTNYYFVINVSTNTVSLAPSRFGIGQFNRSNLPPGTLVKHQLKVVGTNQLIYVGRFSSLFNAKDYARAIVPLLPQIMKVPADKYQFFIITQENLDKLADQKTLDSYFDFYQKKY